MRQRAFSQRLTELMTKYTNQQLTSAEVIAALVEMAKEIAAERDRGKRVRATAHRRPAGVLRRVVARTSRRCEVRTTTCSRDRPGAGRRHATGRQDRLDGPRRRAAKLRSQIKRLLVKHRYPPDQQSDAINLVIEQMEALAPRMAA